LVKILRRKNFQHKKERWIWNQWQAVVLISGACRGIGLATALALAKEGVDIWLYGFTMENLGKVSKELSP
jgi:NADP-dependent 3-hydroxy acid dehydrogenase YdfG